MPTIDQLAAAGQALSSADEIPVTQYVSGNWVVSKTTLGALITLLAGLAVLPPGVIVGMGAPTSGQGSDGWGYINSTNGDVWQRAAGVWTKTGSILGPPGEQGPDGPSYSLAALASVTSMAGTDEVGIVQGGDDKTITLANLLNAETIDLLTASGAASDTDTIMTAQGGGNILTRQTLAALWSWVATHIPGYKMPVLEITGNLTVDATYNGKILVVTAPGVVISPNFSLMGSGFECEIVTSGAGTVVWGMGVTATNGASGLPVSSYANLLAFTSSAGNVVMASIGVSSGSGVSVPGSISGLTFGSATASTLAFTWSAPSSGGSATYYQAQYRVTGTSTWTAAPGTAILSAVITGLTASTEYDVQVAAGNSAGLSAYSGTMNGTTSSSLLAPPGTPTGLTAGSATPATMPLSWTAPSSGGAVATYTVQYRVTSVGGTWTEVTGLTATSATITGLASSTQYDFQVSAVNGGGSSSFTATTNGTTTATGNYLLTIGTRPTAGPFAHGLSGSIAEGVNDNSATADGSYTSPAAVSLGWSLSNSIPPTTGLQAATFTNLDGHNQWVQWMSTPATAGNYYLWAIATNSGDTVVATWVSLSTYSVT